jgi:hypothetical protein
MKNKFVPIFCLLCAAGLAVFADDYGSQCHDNGRMACRDQSPMPAAYNQDFVQNQQNQQNQRATYQPMQQTYQPAYQPMNNYLNFPPQGMQVDRSAYNSFTPGMNNFEQQRVAVDEADQMRFASMNVPQRDFSRAVTAEDPRELSRKIKEAAQSTVQNSTQGYAQDATQGY